MEFDRDKLFMHQNRSTSLSGHSPLLWVWAGKVQGTRLTPWSSKPASKTKQVECFLLFSFPLPGFRRGRESSRVQDLEGCAFLLPPAHALRGVSTRRIPSFQRCWLKLPNFMLSYSDYPAICVWPVAGAPQCFMLNFPRFYSNELRDRNTLRPAIGGALPYLHLRVGMCRWIRCGFLGTQTFNRVCFWLQFAILQ